MIKLDVLRKKYVDFDNSSIKCLHCTKEAIYSPCDKHKDTYPYLTNKNRIRVPNCRLCTIDCPHCDNKTLTVKEYLIKYLYPIEIKKSTEVVVKESIEDTIKNADFSHIRDLNTYKNVTKGALNLIFSFEIGSQISVDKLKTQLMNYGLDINFSSINSVNDRLSLLFYILLMIRGIGLTSFEKEIMEAEIKKLYEGNKEKKNV